jgi:hypothetical protein
MLAIRAWRLAAAMLWDLHGTIYAAGAAPLDPYIASAPL